MDEIKRKLTLIEAQMSPRQMYARRLAKSPLLLPAIGLITGVVLQWNLGEPSSMSRWGWLAILAVCSVGTFAYAARSGGRAAPETIGPLSGLCFVCLGAIRVVAFQACPPNRIEQFVGQERVLSTLQGYITTTPYEDPGTWCFADFAFTDPSTSFYMKVKNARTPDGWVPIKGTVHVHVDEPTPNLRMGDQVQISCWLHRFAEPTNPGQFNVAEYLRRRNIHIGASVASRDAIEVRPGPGPDLLTRFRARLTNAASEALLADVPAESAGRGLLQALVLGNRRDVDPRTYEAFRRTGLLHLISLSGMHLGILTATVWGICHLAGLMKRYRAVVCMLAVALFLLVVPPRAPTVRAAIIVWVFCLSVVFRRHPDPLNTLSLAAVITLLVRPTQVVEAGWQLSFTAVLGILLLTRRFEGLFHSLTRGWLQAIDHRASPPVRAAQWSGRTTIRLLSTGLGAWAGGAGILLYHFYTITLLASLWTVLVFIPVAVILTAGLFRIILVFFLPTVSHLLGGLIAISANVLIRIVKIMAIPQINTILIGHVGIFVVVLYYVGVLGALYMPIRRLALKKALWVAIAIVFVGYLGSLKWHRTHRDPLILTALDVGHGQAVVARLPGSKTILFDAGSLHRSDVGGRIVVPFLDYVGISRLDAIVVSHNDIDHINGIPEVAYRRRVDHIYANEAFFGPAAKGGTARRLIESLRRDGYELERMPETIQSTDATVRKRWPVDIGSESQMLSDNDKSLVCSIEFGGTRTLLCSDIEAYAQRRIMALYPDLKADVVVEPHHGSRVTQDQSFLPFLSPSVIIRSCGPRNAPNATSPNRKSSAKLIDTSQNGAITICVKTQQGGMLIDTTAYLETTSTRRR